MIMIIRWQKDMLSAKPGDPGKLFCLDAKMQFDDNADFRQQEIRRA